MKRNKLTILAAAAGALALTLTACGSGNGGNGDGTDPGNGGNNVDETTLERIQRTGTIRLATANEQPYSWVQDDGTPTGGTVALHEHIFGELGVTDIEIHEVDWNGLIPGLTAGRWDAISAGMSILPDRCAQAAFSEPEIMYTTTLVVAAGNPHGLSDLDSVAAAGNDVTLAVLGGAIEADYARELGISGFNTVDSAEAGITDVENGRADAFALTAVSLNYMTQNNDNVETTEPFVQVLDGVEQVGAGSTVFRQEDTDLLEAYNAELAKVKADPGLYTSIVEPFGFTVENLPPEDLTTEMLCAGDIG